MNAQIQSVTDWTNKSGTLCVVDQKIAVRYSKPKEKKTQQATKKIVCSGAAGHYNISLVVSVPNS